MPREDTWLLEHKKNVHSQSGEDGVISAILDLLPERNRWCVEFGAWDGKLLSNTRYLIERHDYAAVMIEGSASKFRELRANYAHNPKVHAEHAFVGFEEKDGLDTILQKYPIPIDFDFLSIDIDGNDYHTWKSFSRYRPKVICIEFNPTIGTEVHFVQPADPEISQGSSLLSLVELGRDKGYALVSVVGSNAFFVDEKYFHLFEISDNSPRRLRTDSSDVTHMFVGYDGTVHLVGARKAPWHGLRLVEEAFQILPKRLRKYPGNYSLVEKGLYSVFLLAKAPRTLADLAAKRLRKV